MPVCTIPGCPNPASARGLCMMHYMRARRGGDPATKRQAGRKPAAPNTEIDALRAQVASLQTQLAQARAAAQARPPAAPAEPVGPATKISQLASQPATTAEVRAALGIPPGIRRKLTSGEVQTLEHLVDGVANRIIMRHVEQLLWQHLQGVRKTFEQAEAVIAHGRGAKVYTNEQYLRLAGFLHTDGVTTLEEAHRRMTAALQMILDKHLLLRAPTEKWKPSSDLPTTLEEMLARREEVRAREAAKRAQRKASKR
jgi:hypothetical protein